MKLPKLPKLSEIRKALVNAAGLITSLLALGLLPAPYNGWLASAAAVLTVVVHFLTPNAPTAAPVVPAAVAPPAPPPVPPAA